MLCSNPVPGFLMKQDRWLDEGGWFSVGRDRSAHAVSCSARYRHSPANAAASPMNMAADDTLD
jgi:hypothetical protein